MATQGHWGFTITVVPHPKQGVACLIWAAGGHEIVPLDKVQEDAAVLLERSQESGDKFKHFEEVWM